ncbi:MAG: type II toxin-antitoxin system RelE/ParE family toxin [Armatimonadetes bacterium]|nr:type II toxin-antitoxin system RelE/ParE family toxin [Armatimonadota bacterium]
MPDVYRIEIRPAARREMEALHAPMLTRVTQAISSLSSDPRPRGCKKLAGSKVDYRLRVGDYRVLYEVFDAVKLVRVYRIRHRREAYR